MHKFPFVLDLSPSCFFCWPLLHISFKVYRDIHLSYKLGNGTQTTISKGPSTLLHLLLLYHHSFYISIVIIPHRRCLYFLAITFYIHPYTYIDNMHFFLIPALTVVRWVADSLEVYQHEMTKNGLDMWTMMEFLWWANEVASGARLMQSRLGLATYFSGQAVSGLNYHWLRKEGSFAKRADTPVRNLAEKRKSSVRDWYGQWSRPHRLNVLPSGNPPWRL